MGAPNDKKKPAPGDKGAVDKAKIQSHGVSNELELIRLILNENRGLQNRVLDKIRAIRADGKKGAFDDAKAKVAGTTVDSK